LVFDLLKSDLPNSDKLATIIDFDKVLGLGLDKIESEEIPQEIIDLAEERKAAKEQKDFLRSDELRGKIMEAGYVIEDIAGVNYKLIKK
jgi:cysteinyl-tRNA synthetase